jgi:fructose/tagatose bisphosphate aldolase
VLKLFTYAREKGFAIPAANVTSSSTVVAALEAARDNKAPIMYDHAPPSHLEACCDPDGLLTRIGG